jgi:hypothetical protein
VEAAGAPGDEARARTGGRATGDRGALLLGYRVVDLQLTGDDAPVGRRVDEIDWPPLSLPIGLRREGASLRPTPSTVLQKGDRLTILAPESLADQYWDALVARLGRSPARHEKREAGGSRKRQRANRSGGDR